jgi:hypothetical protein
MKGKVEVYAVHSDGSEKLLLEEPNLIVDGAGESIVDMLTTPSSVMGISPRVMDTSNWRWGAISFGPAASSFSQNAYFFPSGGIYYKEDDLCNGVSANVSSYIEQISTDFILRPLWLSSTITDSTPSSYTPPYQLPSYPDVLDKKLEDASTAYSIVSGDGTQSYGQFENRINFASGDPSSYFQGTYPLSGFTANDIQLSAVLVSSQEGDWSADPQLHTVVTTPQSLPIYVGSGYNLFSNMDKRGFIRLAYEIAPDFVHLGAAGVSGSVESDDAVDMVVDPQVTMTTEIASGDLWAMNLYGGLHQIGLWNLNCKESLKNQVPPFSESDGSYFNKTTGVTSREFRLFAKKTFTENLCQVKDGTGGLAGHVWSAGIQVTGSQVSLKILWTIDFRSQHD